MIKNINFLVSCPRLKERDACAEVFYFFSFIGDNEVKCQRSKFPGLLYVKSNLDVFTGIEKLRDLALDDPYSFRFILKIRPIQKIVPTDIENMSNWVKNNLDLISSSETFKIIIEKRMAELNREEIITTLAELIDRKVNLDNPDKILMVQILGDYTGLSIIKPEDIVSIPKILEKYEA
ncbi:MAG: THUMP domain-containing protein [Candidatus Helarchaeota archaeon]